MDGPDASWEDSIAIASEDDIGPALNRLTQDGADFIKLYDGTIAPELYVEILEEAERRGLRTAGHLPMALPFA